MKIWSKNEGDFITVRIPKIFADDREERGLSNGCGYWAKTCYVATLSPLEVEDLESDASLYLSSDGLEPGLERIIRSARRTLKAIGKIKSEVTA